MSKFTEAQLEQAIIELLGRENYPHITGKPPGPRIASGVTVKANQYHYSSFRRKPESSKPDRLQRDSGESTTSSIYPGQQE